MRTREFASVILDCCRVKIDVSFDEADAPFLAPRQLRKNVSCPLCPCFVILTLTRKPDGPHAIQQEVIGFEPATKKEVSLKRSSVKETMSKKLITVKWDQTMEQASELMEEHHFRHLPVADELGVIVGILSDRDVGRAMNPRKPGFDADAQVSDYMSWPVVTVDENLPLREAAQGMIDEKISAFLVTDEKKAIVGIVTSEDLLKALVRLLTGPSGLEKVSYSPVVGELLREAGAAGL